MWLNRKCIAALLVIFVAAGCEPRPEPAKPAEGPFRVGPGVTMPRIIKRVEPRYPELVGTYRIGFLVLECVVTREGTVRDVKIVRGPDNAVTQAVIEAVKQWRFEPGRRDGQAVDVIYNLTVRHVPDGPVVTKSR